ncbi:LysE family translocator [Alphaproteobacteria bacterium]|nr:LysE family translocator [Alphaproteobacteria bacterium]
MSPGPSMVVVVNNAIFKSKFSGILTALGHGFGISIYALCAVIGIGVILQTNIIVFNSIKLLSIFFLFYLGTQTIRSRRKNEFGVNQNMSFTKSFTQGFMISIFNPKIFIWFIAIYSQFMSYDNNMSLNIMLVLVAGTVDAFWYILLVNMVTSKSVLNKIKKRLGLVKLIVGYVLIFISLILLIEIFV